MMVMLPGQRLCWWMTIQSLQPHLSLLIQLLLHPSLQLQLQLPFRWLQRQRQLLLRLLRPLLNRSSSAYRLLDWITHPPHQESFYLIQF